MAGKVQQPEVVAFIDELEEIADQLAAGQQVDRSTVQFSRLLASAADKMKDRAADLIDLGVTEEALIAVAGRLQTWSQGLVPQAATQWRRDEMQAKVAYLTASARLGLLSEEQMARLNDLKPRLTVKARTGGRTPQESIEGRPAQVTMSVGGAVVSTQIGNVTTSPGNLKQAAIRHLAKGAGIDPKTFDKDAAKQLLAAARDVCTGQKKTASALGVTFAAL